MQTDVIPQDGMVITRDTQFAPGVYVLPNGISIGADDITLAGSQTMLLSPAQSGVGIHANNRRNVTVQDLSISGYYHGVRLDSCQNVRIENIRVRDTYEIPGVDTFLYLWQPVEEAYGGAVLFNQVQQAVIKGCDLQHQMNGILLYGCEKVGVEDNNASFNSGRGGISGFGCTHSLHLVKVAGKSLNPRQTFVAGAGKHSTMKKHHL